MNKGNNDPKENFINTIMSMSKDDIEEFISTKGKPRKPIIHAIIVRK